MIRRWTGCRQGAYCRFRHKLAGEYAGRSTDFARDGRSGIGRGPALAQKRSASSWYDRAIIIDGLGGIGDPYGPEEQLRLTDRAWKEMLATGVTVVRDTVMPVGNVADPWSDYQKDISTKQDIVNANPDRLILIRSAADILKAKREGKFGMLIGTQDTSMVGPELDRLAQMKKDGVMTVQLTYNNRNLSGDGSLEPANAGLSKLGKATIERIEAEKLLLDLSHGGARTMAEAAALAKRPLVISHTASRALTDHPRNTADETIKAVADKGGVVGVYFMPFLTLDSHPKGDDLLRHIEHVANVAGEDHVGIGTDNGPLPQVIDAESTKKLNEWAAARIKAGIAAPVKGSTSGRWLPTTTASTDIAASRWTCRSGVERDPAGEADGWQFPARLSRGLGG
ncbi:membrane dipeptidase [Sphingomonas daechungensis]|uniref:Membrane dipeptidase n=1 Tax=Sphingomonas daechungensis TaxID=1176646 RepID=A0ABX6SXN0_9SPHN|nr:membrane dipeptidase [Sphingomonas daechungensis]QNP42351.1 membrane dipeptidase [Sphingomonas daechungensis]